MKNKPEITERELVNSMDARVWAKEFMRLYENSRKAPQNIPDWVDEDLMRGWFANAIMAGYDNATRKLQAENKALKERYNGLIQNHKNLVEIVEPQREMIRELQQQLDKVKGITVEDIAEEVFRGFYVPLYPKDKPIHEMTPTEQGMYKNTLSIVQAIHNLYNPKTEKEG